jgi:L-lysine 6-transaminase
MDIMNIKEVISKKVLVGDDTLTIDPRNCFGSWVVDMDGKQYLDCFSQYGSQALGWNHPKLLNISKKLGDMSVQKLANPEVLTEEYAEFAEEFSNITPDFSYNYFVDGGTLGVENALKAAFDYKYNQIQTEDMDVIHFVGAFHGRSGYTLSLTNNPYSNLKVKHFPKFNWTRVINPAINLYDNVETVENICFDQIKVACKKGNVAALIIEPIQGEGGDNHFRPEFLQGLRKLADENNFMLIFDEVQTGVGTTGKMWCYEHFNVKPDAIAFGKKTSVCGCAFTNKIDNYKDNVFKVPSRISSTWGGNITDMVRAAAVFKIIKEENLVDNAREVGNYFIEKLNNMGLLKVRGRGLFIAFDLNTANERDAFYQKASENMLILKCGEKSIRFRPHLTFSKEDVDIALDLMSRSL